MNDRIQNIETNLKDLKISGRDFHIDMISLVPMYEFEVERKNIQQAHLP